MSYRMQALNRVVSPRFATTPLSPGAIDIRDLYLVRGRLGTHLRTHLVRGPDLRSRVTRFGQGVAFQSAPVFTPKSVTPAAPPTAQPIPQPHFLTPGQVLLTSGPVTFKGPGSPPKVVVSQPTPQPHFPGTGVQVLTGGPSSPTSGGAPPTGTATDSPITFNPQNVGITDQGYTPAAPPFSSGPSGADGSGGGTSFAAPTDGASGSVFGLGGSSLLWFGLGALGLLFLATQRR